jgi:alkanesulfonate monooxygenase SsuD/methylene tetrahydromethanopterin reductase-like flavin-dependent oxidoreductase (luciferase family)
MGVAALAADTEEEARRLSACRNLWVVRLLSGRPIAFPSPEEALATPLDGRELALLKTVEARSVVGTPDQVKARLTSVAERHGAEELVVVTITYDYASRLRSYELLAQAFNLKAS